tara:strand:+ start:1206 stop:1961 length:756 start_codon:yes stop_codon:yes gene_type:complete
MSTNNIYSLISESRPIIIAKYGNSAIFPENTYVSLESAIQNHADIIQIPVQMSSDGYLVVINELHLENKTNGYGLVQSKPLDYLKQLDYGSWFGKQFKNERILTLAEVLKLTDSYLPLSIEIKPNQKSGIEAAIETILLQFDSINIHEIFSSEHRYLKRLSYRNKNIPLGLICQNQTSNESLSFMDIINCNIAHIYEKDISDSFIRNLHSENKIVIVNIDNNNKMINKLIKLGVDCIATNNPENLYKIINI